MMKKLFPSKFYLALSLLIALIAGRLLLTNHHFHTHDDIQVFRLHEFITCFRDGQIPCRWSKNLGKGFGYPLFIFYPPLIYLLPALISSIGFSLITSLNLFALFIIILSAYSMYKLVFTLTHHPALAFLGSVLYTLLPYHAVNIFVRGVYAETLALAIFPLVLASFYQLIKNQSPNFQPALFLTLIFLTHNISAMLMYPLVILWSLVILYYHRQFTRQTLSVLILNLLLPLGLSAFFLLPALFEKHLVQTESMTTGYYSFVNHFVSWKQLFLSTFWGYGGSSFGVKDDGMSFMVGKLYWLPLFILLIIYFFRCWQKRRLPSLLVSFSLFFSFFFLFLTHARSTPLWFLLSPLKYVQFPWRFLGLATFFIVISLILLLFKLFNKSRYLNFLVYIWIIALLIAYLPLFHPHQFDNYQDKDFLNGSLTHLQQQAHVFDYLPKTVHVLPDQFASSPLFVSQFPSTFQTLRWTSNNLTLKLTNPLSQTMTFSLFSYPGWQMQLDGQPLLYHPHPHYGLIQAHIPSGEHLISLRFVETKLRFLADFLSLISLIVFIFLNWLFFSRHQDTFHNEMIQ